MSEKNLDRDFSKISNAEMRDKLAIDINVDPYEIPMEELDPGHPSLFEHNKFYPYFERLRKEDPVHWTPELDGRGFWSVTRHADILVANQRSDIFSSAQGIRIEDQTSQRSGSTVLRRGRCLEDDVRCEADSRRCSSS